MEYNVCFFLFFGLKKVDNCDNPSALAKCQSPSESLLFVTLNLPARSLTRTSGKHLTGSCCHIKWGSVHDPLREKPRSRHVCGRFKACRRALEASPVWVPCPRSHGRTGQWCGHWRTCHIRQYCRSPSWSIPSGSGAGRKTEKSRSGVCGVYEACGRLEYGSYFIFKGLT